MGESSTLRRHRQIRLRGALESLVSADSRGNRNGHGRRSAVERSRWNATTRCERASGIVDAVFSTGAGPPSRKHPAPLCQERIPRETSTSL